MQNISPSANKACMFPARHTTEVREMLRAKHSEALRDVRKSDEPGKNAPICNKAESRFQLIKAPLRFFLPRVTRRICRKSIVRLGI